MFWDVYWVTERRSESPASWILRTPTRKSLPKIGIDKFREFPFGRRRGEKMGSELTGSSSESDVWTLVKVNGGLWEHGVVLEFGTTKGRSVSRDQDEFRLARSHSLQGRLVTKSVLARLDDEGETRVDVVCRLFNLLLSSGGHYNRGKSYSQYTILIVFLQVLSYPIRLMRWCWSSSARPRIARLPEHWQLSVLHNPLSLVYPCWLDWAELYG